MTPQEGELKLNLDENSTNTIDLTALQRVDSSIKEILIQVANVVAYDFDVDSSEWKRKDVEGSLFVVKRDTRPQFQFIMMNRKNAENLVENLLEDFKYEVQLPCLFYRNASQEVNGLRFSDDRECETVANLLSRTLNSCSEVSTTNSEVSPAKSELEKLAAVLSPSVIDGLLKQSSSSINTDNPDIREDPFFINSFNTAMTIGAPNDTISGQPLNSMATVVSISSPQGVARPTLPIIEIPSNLSAARSIMAMIKTPEPSTKHSTNLVTPSPFSPVRSPSPLTIAPISPSMLADPNTPVNMHRTHSAPLLQSFPPPTLPPSLTPTSLTPPSLTPTSLLMPFSPPGISRERVQEALQLLVQDNEFIEVVYQAVMKAQQS